MKSNNTDEIIPTTAEESSLQQLKRKVKKIEALAEFYDEMENRQTKRYTDIKDTSIKTDFAKKQIMALCEEVKKIIQHTQNTVLQKKQ